MKKYNFDINNLRSIAYDNIHQFEFAGCGMYNLNLSTDSRLSFKNECGLVFQVYPNGEGTCWVLNYYKVSIDNADHGNLNFFNDLEDWEQDILFELICNKLYIDVKKYINPNYNIFQKLLNVISNTDCETLFNFIQSNAELKKIFDANVEVGYKWYAKSNDECFEDESKEIFNTKEECYNSMRDAALEKAKWNTEFTDFDIPLKELENDPMDANYSDNTIGYKIKFTPTKIIHESYSGIYTYEMKKIYVCCGKQISNGFKLN